MTVFSRYVTINVVQVNPYNRSRYPIFHTMRLSHWTSGGYGYASTTLVGSNVASALWSGNTSPQASVKVATLIGPNGVSDIRTQSAAVYGSTVFPAPGVDLVVHQWGNAWYSEHTWRYRNWNYLGQEWSVRVQYDVSPLIAGGIAYRGETIQSA